MRQFIRYFAIIFVVLLVASVLVGFFNSPSITSSTAALSDIVAKVNAGLVKEIDVQNDDLTVILKDDSQITAKKETSISAFETLLNLGADKAKLTAVKTVVKQDSAFSILLASLIPIVLPFILIGAIFWFMFRKAQQG